MHSNGKPPSRYDRRDWIRLQPHIPIAAAAASPSPAVGFSRGSAAIGGCSHASRPAVPAARRENNGCGMTAAGSPEFAAAGQFMSAARISRISAADGGAEFASPLPIVLFQRH